MKELNIKKAIIRYNNMMSDFCLEHNTIGTRLSENTENWNLRDMVSECQYQLECCYEDGNANEEGRYPEYWEITSVDILSPERFRRIQFHNDSEKEMHKDWISKTRRLRNFIKVYEPYIKDMKCAIGHCSCYDN